MIKRLRDKYTDEQLKNIYSKPHEHHHWLDHVIRVNRTIEVAKQIEDVSSVADLSAGDAAIINSLDAEHKYIGDYAPKYEFEGPIEKTINEIPSVDLFICSETLEHVDDPAYVLKLIRSKTKNLVLTTPEGKFDDTNPEHYWAWDNEGIKKLLVSAGFNPIRYDKLNLSEKYYYDYQIWVCE
jgi:hypothetical protein